MSSLRLYGFILLTGMVAAIQGPTPYTLSYPAYFGNRINTPEDNPLTVEGVDLGRRLFYEKRLSVNNTISCGSCHFKTLEEVIDHYNAHVRSDAQPFSEG